MTAEQFWINFYRFSRWDIYARAHFFLRSPAKNLPPLQSAEETILNNLRKDGFAQSSLTALQLPFNSQLERAVENAFPKLLSCGSVNPAKPYNHQLTQTELQDSGLINWGLDERLLSLATNYLKTPVTFQGLVARRDDPDGKEVETRMWHRDPEDFKILKAVVYLNDVTEDDGPFECIPKQHTLQLDWHPKNRKGRLVKTEKLENLKVSLTGRKGTVLFADTCRMYHRGKMNTKGSRFALFYTYHPKSPAHPAMCKPLYSSQQLIKNFPGELTAFQLSAINFQN